MNWADYTIIAVLGRAVLMGLWRGFVAEVLALAVWVCAFWVAWLLGPTLAEHFSASISTPSARVILAYGLSFLAVLILGAIVAFLVRKLVESSGLSGSDRLLGMVFGLVRGLALVVFVVLLLGFTPFTRDPWWQQSRLLPGFERSASWLAARLPEQVSRYLHSADGLIGPAMDALPLPPGAKAAPPQPPVKSS